jgi:hypothetical protein
MANVEDESPEFVAVQEKMAQIIRETTQLWGPRKCNHSEDWYTCDEEDCKYADTVPNTNAMLTEFIIIGTFMDMETGKSDLSHISPPRQPWHHTLGMVHAWLE